MVLSLVEHEQEDAQDDAIHTKSAPILDLIQLVQSLQQTYRLPTSEEQERLGQFMGWGPVAPALAPYPQESWAEIGAQLRLLLGDEGTKAAEQATPTSYFTDRYLIDALWTLARRLGFDGGRVLDAGRRAH